MCMTEFCGSSDYCNKCVNNPNKEVYKMTKKEILEAMTDLDDDAIIYVAIDGGEPRCYIPIGYCDKVTGNKILNEITFICK